MTILDYILAFAISTTVDYRFRYHTLRLSRFTYFEPLPIIELPAGVRKVVLGDGSTEKWVVSDLDPAWGMDSDGNLLPQEFFVGDGDNPTFGQKVNSLLGYDAVQHPDHVNG